MRRFDRSALISGIVFIVLGVLFLLEQYDVLDVRASFVLPIVLVGIGVWLVTGRDRPHRPATSHTTMPEAPPQPPADPPPTAPQA